MDFGERVLKLRKQKRWSREQLGRVIKTSGAIIGKYERNERTPSVVIAQRLAIALDVSLDYLVGNTDLELDKTIIRKIEEIQNLPEEDRQHLFYLLDNVLQNVKTRQAFA